MPSSLADVSPSLRDRLIMVGGYSIDMFCKRLLNGSAQEQGMAANSWKLCKA